MIDITTKTKAISSLEPFKQNPAASNSKFNLEKNLLIKW